jgi:tetratricopeptide (TPR) repeat protein
VLHRRIAQALEQTLGEPPPALLAYHYARSAATEKANTYLERAGDQAQEQHANAEAAGYYRDLIGRLETLGRAGEAARAREKLGDVLIILGRYDEALRTLEQAADTYRTRGDVEGLASTLGRIAYTHARGGRARDWLAQAEPMHEAERLATAGPASRGVASLYASLAVAFNNAGRHAEQLDAALRGAELARAVGDEAILAYALVMHGLALEALGQGNEAQAVCEEAAVLAERLGELNPSARAQMTLGSLCDARGDFAAARTWHERAAAAVTRFGDSPMVCFVLSVWSDSAYWSGDWPWSRALAARAAAAVRSVDRAYAASYPPLARGRLDLAQGDWEAASTALLEAVRLATATGNPDVLRTCQALLAERDLLACHPEAACERLAPLLDPPDQQDVAVTRTLPLLAWAYCDLGEQDRAEALAKQAVQLAERQDQRLALVDALRISALVASRTGRWPEAAAALEDAIARSHAMPYPYAEAKALYVYGLLYLESGEPEQARKRFEAARAILGSLGERLYAEQAERALERLACEDAEPPR